jgi:hypothetical protein
MLCGLGNHLKMKTMVAKSLKEVMVEKKNLDICHLSII